MKTDRKTTHKLTQYYIQEMKGSASSDIMQLLEKQTRYYKHCQVNYVSEEKQKSCTSNIKFNR